MSDAQLWCGGCFMSMGKGWFRGPRVGEVVGGVRVGGGVEVESEVARFVGQI